MMVQELLLGRLFRSREVCERCGLVLRDDWGPLGRISVIHARIRGVEGMHLVCRSCADRVKPRGA